MSDSFYAILDHRGVMVDQRNDLMEAAEAAGHGGFRVDVDASVLVDPSPRQNPGLEGMGAGEAAAEACRIKPLNLGEYREIPIEKAKKRALEVMRHWHRELTRTAPEVMRGGGAKGGLSKEVDTGYVSPTPQIIYSVDEDTGVKKIIGHNVGPLSQNMKQAKILSDTDLKYDSMGLALIPHNTPFQAPWKSKVKDGHVAPSFCMYSTDECRATCLVNTGQRRLTSGSYVRSFLSSKLLLEDTPTFMRIFYECAVSAFLQAPGLVHKASDLNKNLRRFLRANVMSDIPWELVMPGFLEATCEEARHFAKKEYGINWKGREDGFLWYDYTKVPHRRVDPETYDLTYSFMGQLRFFDAAVAAGRKVAVVFVKREMDLQRSEAHPKRRPTFYRDDAGKSLKAMAERVWEENRWPEDYYPWTFFDHAVWNGDKTDIRALDPEGTQIIGLSYKTSMYKKVARLGDMTAKGAQKAFTLEQHVPPGKLDTKSKRFLVRVMQPDPEAPPVVVPTQDPANRTIWTGII